MGFAYVPKLSWICDITRWNHLDQTPIKSYSRAYSSPLGIRWVVFSGVLESDSRVLNVDTGEEERMGQISVPQGREQIPVSRVVAGDIGVVAKLSETLTGHALCDQDHPVRLPGIDFPNVRNRSVAEIWHGSDAFNRFRGYDWMEEPCRSCDEKEQDFGGCRCQAYMLTGDASAADPVCDKSPFHDRVVRYTGSKRPVTAPPLVFRNPRNARRITGGDLPGSD